MNLTRFFRSFVTGFAFLGLAATSLYAGAPGEINYQGKLADSTGNPITGNIPMVFEIYENATGGSPLYTETKPGVSVSNGVFSVVIGESTPISTSTFQGADTGKWLQVTVNGTPLLPRQKLVAAPYALAVATSSVGTNEIIDGSIGLNDLNPGYPGCSNGEIPKISGGVWTCQADGGATYTADESGITLVGSQFRLELYGTTLASDANGLRVNAIGTTEITNDAIRGEDLDKGDVKLKAGSDGKYYSTYAPD